MNQYASISKNKKEHIKIKKEFSKNVLNICKQIKLKLQFAKDYDFDIFDHKNDILYVYINNFGVIYQDQILDG